MNRILMESAEVDADGRVTLTDRRAGHIAGVLKPVIGQALRIGLLDGPVGEGTVCAVEAGGVTLRCRFESAAPPPSGLNLLLALPRPKVLKRLWAPLASLGLDRILLTNAAKVERHYDTHWLGEPGYRPLLIEGLQQAGLTRLPVISVHRRLRPLMEDELEARVPDALRLVAHPAADGGMGRVALTNARPVLLAVGPEGGWDAFELKLLAAQGFKHVSLAGGPLRSDVACIALLAVLRELRLVAPLGSESRAV